MKLLVVDCGNTRIKWKLLQGALPAWEGTVLTAASHHLSLKWEKIPSPDLIIISNVAGPIVADELTRASEALWGVAPRFVKAVSEEGGVSNGYARPETMGVDRWAALVGARAMNSGPLCVVDCGTAITIDALDAEGTHLGGMIIPGLELMAEALLKGTQGVRTERRGVVSGWWGNETQTAVEFGTTRAAASLISAATMTLTLNSGAEGTCILTGGNASDLNELITVKTIEAPSLVLQGLALIAAARGWTG